MIFSRVKMSDSRLENCRLSFYDITKKFINKKECFNCDKPVDLEYIFLINHGYKDELLFRKLS